MKKIAFCLYGQPREYLKGYHTNRILKERYPEIGVDYYYHTWIKDNLAGDQYYEASEWRNISSDLNALFSRIGSDRKDAPLLLIGTIW